jgi:hypothetical protein
LTKDQISAANGLTVKKIKSLVKTFLCYPMEKIDFSIRCVHKQLAGSPNGIHYEPTPIGLQLVLVSDFWSVPFPNSGWSRDLKKNFALL